MTTEENVIVTIEKYNKNDCSNKEPKTRHFYKLIAILKSMAGGIDNVSNKKWNIEKVH